MPKQIGLFSSTNLHSDGDAWIQEILRRTKPFLHKDVEKYLIIKLLDEISLRFNIKEKSLHLAAAFDLLVAAEYYHSVVRRNGFIARKENLRFYSIHILMPAQDVYSKISLCTRKPINLSLEQSVRQLQDF